MARLQMANNSSPPLLRIEPFKGMNLSVTPTQIDQSQSPDMCNFNIDERGALNKRTGYERVFQTSLGIGAINGVFQFKKPDGTATLLLAHGTKLYTQKNKEQPVQIYDGLANARIKFFVVNDKCYMLDGTNYLVYDGTTVTPVKPYIPQVSISRAPEGGGSKDEDFNLLGSGFKDSFSADGTATVFTLSVNDIDSTAVTAEVNGVAKVETTDFTVDRVAGKVTFKAAPTKGTNNVIITAYKTRPGLPDRIKKSTLHTMYGGSNDTRLFLSGNPIMPEYVWRSDIYDPSYFPENGFYKYPSHVKGFSKQFDYLVIHRENGMHHITYTLNSNGEASFPSKPINDQVGTIAPESIQLVDNNPVSLSKDGVYMLTASNVRDERNMASLSDEINPKLLQEINLTKAISIDYANKYWLAVNNNVYIFDYLIKQWYVYSNIPASCFIEIDSDLYFGSNNEGLLYRFMRETEPQPYSDDGKAINAYWKSKYLTFNADELKKVVEKVYYSLKPSNRTSLDVYYVTNKKESGLIKTTRMDTLDFWNIDFSYFTFLTSDFPQESVTKIKAKKITHFQLIIRNDRVDESIGLLSLGIKFNYQSAVK